MNYLKTLFVAIILLVSGCAHHFSIDPGIKTSMYVSHGKDKSNIGQYAPVFISYGTDETYNRIGQPYVYSHENGGHSIRMDTDHPVTYYMEKTFKTSNGVYKNLIYRIHFSKTPFSILPFNLTAGSNVGLIVVITFDAKSRPILVTTVHTCGCYLAIIPTSNLFAEAWPEKWPGKTINVFGETLPSILDYSNMNDPVLMVYLRPGVHRVMDVRVTEKKTIHTRDFQSQQALLLPIGKLEKLRWDGNYTGFYHKSGLMKGHVKGAVKVLETVFFSWFSLDLFVGTDKIYGDRQKTGSTFYTSIKPWNRKASDMWNFARFLSFWGWRL